MIASRTSSRIPRDGISITEKASKRARERNDTSGMFSQNPFTVLNNTSNAYLHAVMLDLDLEVDNIDEQIDVFKLEELARVAMAEANYNHFLETQKAKTAPQNNEETADVSLEVISNEVRDCSELVSKGEGILACSEPDSVGMTIRNTS